jgi:colanic acid biosynthesis protein WcaH
MGWVWGPRGLIKIRLHETVMILPSEEYKNVLSAIPIVCVDCLVVNENGEYLLVKRANPPLKGEYWVPGGRLYKNERILEAVHRKMREEIGIGVDVVTILGILEFFDPANEYSEGGVHTISIVYLVKPLSYDIKLDAQATDWGWFKELPEKLRIAPLPNSGP